MDRANLIYLTYNSEADVDHLKAIVGTAGEQLPVIAIDNDSRDASVEKMMEMGVNVLGMTENLGFTAAINHGLKRCDAEWALIINPDVRMMQNEWLPNLLDVPDDWGIVGARLVNDTQVMGGGYVMDRSAPIRRSMAQDACGGQVLCQEHLGWSRLSQHLGGMADFVSKIETAWVAFAVVALRMDMVRAIGLLDETYWHYVSDQELCFRAWSNEWKVGYVPANFWHSGGTALQFAPPSVSDFVREDIRRWCRVEHEYLAASNWA